MYLPFDTRAENTRSYSYYKTSQNFVLYRVTYYSNVKQMLREYVHLTYMWWIDLEVKDYFVYCIHHQWQGWIQHNNLVTYMFVYCYSADIICIIFHIKGLIHHTIVHIIRMYHHHTFDIYISAWHYLHGDDVYLVINSW